MKSEIGCRRETKGEWKRQTKRERERAVNPQMGSLIELRCKWNGIEAKGVEDKADTMPIPLQLLLNRSALEFARAVDPIDSDLPR